MPRTETYEQPIKCRKCGHCGTAVFKEFENPVFAGSNLGTHVRSVSDGFTLDAGRIRCKCGAVIRTP
jgi:hypothetical protein